MKTMTLAATLVASLALATAPAAAKPGQGGTGVSNNGGGNNGGGNNGGGNNGGNNGGGNGGGGNNGGGNSGGGNGGGSTPSACQLGQIVPVASACSGFFAGNLLNNNQVTQQQSALQALGYNWNGNWNAVDKISSLNGATLVDIRSAFGKTLTATSIIGIHFGNGAGLGGQVTGFWTFDAGSGLDTIGLNILQGSSGFVLYATGIGAPPPVTPPVTPPVAPPGGGGGENGVVPEPSSWALLITGFAAIGAALRRRRLAFA